MMVFTYTILDKIIIIIVIFLGAKLDCLGPPPPPLDETLLGFPTS